MAASNSVNDACVITVSDGCARGEREDRSGPEACRLLREAGLTVDGPFVLPDEQALIAARLREAALHYHLVATTGGTGLGPRDVTPEATREVIEREAPGLAELMRARGLAKTPLAALSRGVVGARGSCLIVNLPGSPKACAELYDAIAPALEHGLRLLLDMPTSH